MMWALGWIVGLDRGNPDGRDGEGQGQDTTALGKDIATLPCSSRASEAVLGNRG
jgi:hypothetical protein